MTNTAVNKAIYKTNMSEHFLMSLLTVSVGDGPLDNVVHH